MSLSLFRVDPLGLFDDIFMDDFSTFHRLARMAEQNTLDKAPAKGKRTRGAPAKKASSVTLPSTALSTDVSQELASLWRPNMDVIETEKNYLLHAELPGMSKEDVHIELDDETNTITISGERVLEKKEESDRVYRSERRSGRFIRSMKVPEGIKQEDIKASLQNGVLEVIIPKTPAKEEKKEAKRIKIM